MKRLVALTLVLLAATAGTAWSASIGLGVFAGTSIPVVQEDVGQGALVGLRAPVKLIPLLTVEPYYASSSLGDKDVTVAGLTYTSQGPDEKAYGLNAMLTTGGPVQFYPFAGIGTTQLDFANTSKNLTTYNFGLGLGITPVPKLSVHVRGELQMAVDSGASRKFANVTAGASYALFSLP